MDLRLDLSHRDITPLIEALERLEDGPRGGVACQDVQLSAGVRLRFSLDYWQRLVRHLRAKHPLKHHRLVVKRCKLSEDCGLTYPPSPGGTISIVVCGTKTMTEQVDTLIHEWAHALLFDVGWKITRGDPHIGQWGRKHAAVYRTWVAWQDRVGGE